VRVELDKARVINSGLLKSESLPAGSCAEFERRQSAGWRFGLAAASGDSHPGIFGGFGKEHSVPVFMEPLAAGSAAGTVLCRVSVAVHGPASAVPFFRRLVHVDGCRRTSRPRSLQAVVCGLD